MKVKIAQSVDEKAWDALVAEASGGHFFQSAAWAALQREYFGVKNYFFTVEDPSVSKPLALMRADRESPLNRWLFEKPLSSATVPLADRLSAEVSVKYGPLYLGSPGRQDKARMFSLLLDSLESHCRSQGVVSLKGAFGSIYGAEEEDHDQSEIKETLQAGGYRATKAATFLVDLRPDEDTLWRNLKQSARKAVRHGREQGITV
ncbi:MAG: hypothetical protein JXQ83_13345, partial [Candidatus Glassbacteria bacterium]|nr:hypothetical protein [Candidatus Glassbacteria bacterium]